MSATPQKEETAQEQPQPQEMSESPAQSPDQRQMQDTETEEAADDTEQVDKKDEKEEEEDKSQEDEEEEMPASKTVKTPVQAAPTAAQRTPRQAVTSSTSKSATKRKFDALHARSSAAEPSIYQHEKIKKARASALMKTPATKVIGATKKVTKTREFSFARPTASSARRTAAVAKEHAQAKTTPQPPARKTLHPKHPPAKAVRASTPAPKTPADNTSRAHFSYTPYTGPLPPLTVESSFAPKNSQVLDRWSRTTSPTRTKASAAGRKPHPASAKKTQQPSSTGKENNGVTHGGAATNDAPSSSKTQRTPVKSSSGSPVSKEENRSAFKEKVKAQRSLAQQEARPSPTASSMDPMA